MFELHGVKLQQSLSYKYLGVHLHQSLGRNMSTRDLCPQSYEGRLFFDDDYDEMRRIARLRFDGETDTWVAVSERCDSRGQRTRSNATVEYWLTRESDIDQMIAAASTLLQSEDRPPSGPMHAWSEHVKYVSDRLRSKAFMLRRMQCAEHGFSPRTACGLIRSFASTSANYASEIWNTANSSSLSALETSFSYLHQRVLGCQSNTPHKLMNAELGLLGPRSQRDVCSLMFLWRILRMPRERLTRVPGSRAL